MRWFVFRARGGPETKAFAEISPTDSRWSRGTDGDERAVARRRPDPEKADGEELHGDRDSIPGEGAARETIPGGAAVAAWLMAVFLRGLTLGELDTLTTGDAVFGARSLDHNGSRAEDRR